MIDSFDVPPPVPVAPTRRPFVGWSEIETMCTCWRRRCRHKRRDEARNLAQRIDREQIEALTDDDVAWLRSVGWAR